MKDFLKLRICLLFILFGNNFSTTFAQNPQELITNGSFEIGIEPWFSASKGKVFRYFSLTNTQPGEKVPTNDFGTQWALPILFGQSGRGYVGLDGGGTREFSSNPSKARIGIKLSTPMEKGKTYLIECYVSRAETSDNGNVSFKFQISKDVANGLPDRPKGRMQIGKKNDFEASDDGKPDDKRWQKVSFTYTHKKDDAYPFFFIKNQTVAPKYKAFYLDEVSVTKLDECGNACCPETAIYQGINTLPPYTSTKQTIQAGSQVDINKVSGNVTVQSGQNVKFQAGKEVRLEPGFNVSSGAIFEAKIAPCSEAPLSIRISDELRSCSNLLCASVCGGSNTWTLSWSHGLGSSQQVEVSPSVTTTYNVTVTDRITMQSTSQSVTVIPSYFPQPITIEGAPNAFSPNGDGINDMWIPYDHYKTEYAFNAYRYELYIANRWGAEVYNVDESVIAPGLSEGDIYWDGRDEASGNLLPDATYYYSLKLYSCTDSKTFNGPINLIGGVRSVNSRLSFDEPIRNASIQTYTNNLLDVYPNPLSTIANFNYSIKESGSVKLYITNLLGQEIAILVEDPNHEAGNFSIDFDGNKLPAGLYLYTLQSNNYKETKRIVIVH